MGPSEPQTALAEKITLMCHAFLSEGDERERALDLSEEHSAGRKKGGQTREELRPETETRSLGRNK